MRTNLLFPLRRLPGRVLPLLLPALLALATGARAATWTEPPIVIYGRVLNLGNGAAHQLFSGVLRFTVTTPATPGQPARSIPLVTDLHPVGSASEYSYRVEIPQYFQPGPAETPAGLAIGVVPQALTLQATYADSETSPLRRPVTLLDPSQLEKLVVQQKSRGEQFRVDLAVDFVEVDSDADGLPDWWEDANRLNKFSAADAGQDLDGDRLVASEEYRLGTDPRVANLVPVVRGTQLVVPAGGRAGLALTVVDQDTRPENLLLSWPDVLPGLTWRLRGQPLEAGTEFSYQAVLDGEVTCEAAPAFVSGVARLRVRDAAPPPGSPQGAGAVVEFNLQVNAFSPGTGSLPQPVVWLDGGMAALGGSSVGEWADRSGAGRDAYQPATAAQPSAQDGEVRFGSGRFLYLDERGLASPIFTALVAFEPEAGGGSSQTVLRTSDLQLEMRTVAGVRHLEARQAGRTTLAPLARADGAAVYTLTAGEAGTQLEAPDDGVSLSAPGAAALAPAFATLGASYPFGARASSNHLQGRLREVVLFDFALPPVTRARLQDYLLSRWEGFLVWDYRHSAQSLRLAGQEDVRNSLNGGYGNDQLQGGSRGDVLRGGPGRNTLAGGGGPDRFAFARTASQDVVTDFNAAEGDVIDLAEVINAPAGGTPPNLSIRPQVTRGPNNQPRVDTRIELRYGGPGTVVDQVITLQNVAQLPASALRLPAVGVLPAPPTFVAVEAGGSVVADANWEAVVPNVVDGSLAVDRNGAPVGLYQSPAAGTRVGPGSTLITLMARDDAWNTASTTTPFVVLTVGGSHALAWSRGEDGGLRLTVPAGTVLESAAELTGPWQVVPATGTVDIDPDPAQPARFFRLRAN